MGSDISMRSHQKTLLIAGLLTLAGFLVPLVREVLLPVMYLNTHIHELSHAIMAKITGGEVLKIVVNADGSGETPVMGGSLLLIACAGYLGASIVGAAMIALGSSEKNAKRTLSTLAGFLGLSMLVWVRGDTVGVIAGFAWVLILGGMAIFLSGKMLVFCCQFLGLQQCLNSLMSLFALLRLTASTEAHSDASILQSLTGFPSFFFALCWSLFSIILIGFMIKNTWVPIPIKSDR